MLRTKDSRAGQDRRGMILLVVLAMLTLFAVVGLTFVLTADSLATSARNASDAETQTRPNVDPEAALAFILGQLIYDVSDMDQVGVYSALRGQSLARNMYGWDEATSVILDKPYNGTGRLHFPSPPQLGLAFGKSVGGDDCFLMNFQCFPSLGDNFVRDPERYGSRASPTAQRGPYVGGFAVPYTYPDHQNFYLAQIDPVTGQVVVPSFHRDYLFGSLASTPQTNPNWDPAKSAAGKYLTLRPRPLDNGLDANGNPLFPYPVDAGGDVKNLDWAPGGCDSIWIDVGAPVLTAPDGRKYKMLVAPLILELDGRLNLNVIGNILGASSAHRSNQGWGPWEIDPNQVLNAPRAGAEVLRLFTGSNATAAARVRGRYDTATAPRIPLGPALGGGNLTRLWAQVDYNGMQDTNAGTNAGAQSQPYLLPGVSGTCGYQVTPNFPGTTYSNGNNGENTNHPSIYNAWRPTPPNRTLPLYGMAALLRMGGTGGDVLTSDVLRLCPTNLITDASATRRRNQVTLLSCDLDRPGATPYVWNPADTSTPPQSYRLQAMADGTLVYPPIPSGNQPIPFPALGTAPIPANSEFDGNWRSLLALLGRLDLNRPLTAFPNPDPTTGLITDTVTAQQALTDRQNFALAIFNVLRQVTGALDLTTASGAGYGPTSPEYRALRYLAQLAVNIVDYIDTDGYSTPFNWLAPVGGTEYVFGFELPRLVINEAYAQYDNWTTDLTAPPAVMVQAGGNDHVDFWVELHNPLPDDPVSSGGTLDCQARLQVITNPTTGATAPVYQVVLADGGINTPAVLRDPANTTGYPDWNLGAGPSRVRNTINCSVAFFNWGPATGANTTPQSVSPLPTANRFNAPANAANPQVGFYLLAPPQTNFLQGAKTDPVVQPTSDPQFPAPSYASPQMTFTVPVGSPVAGYTVLLQRLANPALLPQTDATKPLYNPYITVDFMELSAAQVNDGRWYNDKMAIAGGPPAGAMTARKAWGRSQPYAAAAAQLLAQPADPNVPPKQPCNTFFRQNSTAVNQADLDKAVANGTGDATLKIPFDWLAQVDRQLISPVELWTVSPFKSFEVTQLFVQAAGMAASAQQHTVPWVAPPPADPSSSRLYRFFEFVETGPRAYGTVTGGRIPGKINLNAVWTPEVFRALVAQQAGNNFSAGEVDTIFSTLLAQRSQGTSFNPATQALSVGKASPTDPTLATLAGLKQPDQPFWSLSTGYAAGGDALGGARGIANTLLRLAPSGAPNLTFDTPRAHPYQKKELLNKIFNSVTTRSNVFAVWLTVGFFEVVDDTARPVKLGAEIGKSENRQIRHRMFAIIDRTQLKVGGQSIPGPVTAGQRYNLNNLSFSDPRTGRTGAQSWQVQPGNLLVLEPDPNPVTGVNNEETVVVQQDPKGQLFFMPVRSHPLSGGTTVPLISRCNPGPWIKYDPRQDTDVVPYFAIID